MTFLFYILIMEYFESVKLDQPSTDSHITCQLLTENSVDTVATCLCQHVNSWSCNLSHSTQHTNCEIQNNWFVSLQCRTMASQTDRDNCQRYLVLQEQFLFYDRYVSLSTDLQCRCQYFWHSICRLHVIANCCNSENICKSFDWVNPYQFLK